MEANIDGKDLIEMRKSALEAKWLIFTTSEDQRDIRRLVAAGAAGYVLKTATDDELLRAIEAVHAGDAYFSPRIAGILAKDLAEGTGADPALSRLTPRELEVMQLVIEGKTNRQIGEHLNISFRTVEVHRVNLSQKLGIHGIAELTRFAIARGIIRP